MANRFEIAHAQAKGSITPGQEKYLVNQTTVTLARYRRELHIFGAIPKLSKGDAWRLIHAIQADLNGGAA